LVHAEIEQYLEDRVRDVSDKAVTHWLATQAPNSVILSILAYGGDELAQPRKAPLKLEPIADKVRRKKADFHKSLSRSNHGVKEANLTKLLMPIGIAPNDLDSAWVADMNTFGSNRGGFAHNSATSIKSVLNPKDEYEMVQRLLQGLGDLDERLSALL